jgi:general secretion pathway protein A
MYHQHFGLSGPPFQFTPLPEALYLSRTHREGLAALEWGLLHDPTGFSLLVGESGVGKTTLVCSILSHGYNSLRAAFVTNPKLNFDQIMQVVMSQLAPRSSGQSRLELIQSFTRLVMGLSAGERAAIIIDEAQDLSDETFEDLRLLSNADTGRERRFQMVFVGQPEFLARLSSPRLGSLNQRIGARAALSPLRLAEAHEYIECRLRAKGGSSHKIFANGALEYLVSRSGGIPRKINVLCHNAMLLAYAGARKKVTLPMARSAVAEYQALAGVKHAHLSPDDASRTLSTRARRLFAPIAALGTSMLALAGASAFYIWNSQPRFPEAPNANRGRIAIRPQSGPDTTGPGILLGRVAQSATQAKSAAAAMLHASATPRAASAAPGAASDLPGTASDPRPARSIRVQTGDTLAKIAARYLGSPDAIDALLDANPQLRDVDRIYVGQTLYLPPTQPSRTR